ncbi:MAG: S49 family peptidase [Planctomycetota bacterium]
MRPRSNTKHRWGWALAGCTALTFAAGLSIPVALADEPAAVAEVEAQVEAQVEAPTPPAAATTAEVPSEAAAPSRPVAPEAQDADTQRGQVGWLELSDGLREGPEPVDLFGEGGTGEPSLRDVLGQVRHVAESDDHRGLVLFLDQPGLGLTQIEAIGAELRAMPDDKPVVVFAEAYSLPEYLLASSADWVVLQDKGSVWMTGLGMEQMYLAGLLEKIGVKADFVQIGDYKGAAEPLTNRAPSPEWDQNINGLLDGMYQGMSSWIAEGRGWTHAEFEAVLADSVALTDAQLVERGVVDRLDGREMQAVAAEVFGTGFQYDAEMGFRGGSVRPPDNPFALFAALLAEDKRKTRGPTVAVYHLNGPITSGEGSRGDGFFASESIGSRTVLETLSELRFDDNVQGVVLRIDSPGGSALASEVMWQAIRDLAEDKPVYASVGGMAASGGYYLACSAERIYVRPTSIVGSIGVVGGKLTMGELYDWLDVNVVVRTRGPNGDLFNSVEGFSDDQRAMLAAAMTATYKQFLDRVQRGRGDRVADLDAVTQGRLFTGQQAKANGLADELGGVDTAVWALADQLGLDEGDYDVLQLPRPMNFSEFLESLAGGQAQAQLAAPGVSSLAAHPMAQTLRQLLGPEAWRDVTWHLTAVLQLREEPVLLTTPTVLRIR